MSQNETDIRNILSTHKNIAMVGASSNPERASNHVLEYLLQAGYMVFPVNPKDEELFGQKVYRRLEDIPHPIDIVDVFRNPADAPAVAREAVEAGAKVLWLQEGVISEEAARIAAEGGLRVVMDRCMLKEHQRLKI
ncbi:MAG: CoA-binding protein [Desulfuromonadales bacterium]